MSLALVFAAVRAVNSAEQREPCLPTTSLLLRPPPTLQRVKELPALRVISPISRSRILQTRPSKAIRTAAMLAVHQEMRAVAQRMPILSRMIRTLAAVAAGNGGSGGYGGYGWDFAGIFGGHFGSAFPFSTNVLVMGGAGGAGTTNNGTADPANTNPAGINSSGGAGGGIVIIRAGSVVGTGAINANGQSALNVLNDGGGGGGAGWFHLGFRRQRHVNRPDRKCHWRQWRQYLDNGSSRYLPWKPARPGRRWWCGAVILSSAPAAASSVSGGINGFSTTAQDAFGSTPGLAGSIVSSNMTITQTPARNPVLIAEEPIYPSPIPAHPPSLPLAARSPIRKASSIIVFPMP